MNKNDQRGRKRNRNRGMIKRIEQRIVMKKQITKPGFGDLCALNKSELYRKNREISVAGKVENNRDEDHSKSIWL